MADSKSKICVENWGDIVRELIEKGKRAPFCCYKAKKKQEEKMNKGVKP